MPKLLRSDIIQIIKNTSHITIDASAYNCSDIKEFAKQCKEQNCILTLQNANHFNKSEIIGILNNNPDVEIVISNPDTIVSQKNVDNILKESQQHSKILSEIKKKADELLRTLKSRR